MGVLGQGSSPSYLGSVQEKIRLLEVQSSQDRLPELKKTMKGLLTDLLDVFQSDGFGQCVGTDLIPPNAELMDSETSESDVFQHALQGIGLDEDICSEDEVAEQDWAPVEAN